MMRDLARRLLAHATEHRALEGNANLALHARGDLAALAAHLAARFPAAVSGCEDEPPWPSIRLELDHLDLAISIRGVQEPANWSEPPALAWLAAARGAGEALRQIAEEG